MGWLGRRSPDIGKIWVAEDFCLRSRLPSVLELLYPEYYRQVFYNQWVAAYKSNPIVPKPQKATVPVTPRDRVAERETIQLNITGGERPNWVQHTPRKPRFSFEKDITFCA